MSTPIGKYEVVIIEEGLGNLNDLSYYTRQALESAAANKLFEGAQAFADHPSKDEEVLRPERSVRDLIGFYSDTRVIDNPDGGTAMLVGTLTTNPGDAYEWSRSLIETSIDNSGRFDKELIGISINAGGGYVKKNIDDVLNDETLPLSVKPKLVKAKGEGATEVDWCMELADVVSADLVTRAGARGRALKRLIESERNRMASPKKKNLKENEKKQSEDEALPSGDHADEQQDKELIASMLKKYVGGDDHSEEAHHAMAEAHKAAKEMGLEGEEAEKAAGYSMKMAKHAAEKKQSESESEDESEKKESEDESEGGDGDADDKQPPAKKMESEIIRLKATVAGLQKKVRENEVNEFLAKTIRESGFEGKIAKKFKESIGEVQSEKEIMMKAKIFKEALALAQGGPIYINPEKTSFNGDATVSFADCVKEN